MEPMRSIDRMKPITEPATVLVVDDADTKRSIVSSWLKRARHRVVEASTAAEAFERLAEDGIDLVVLGVMLPDMDGLDVCEQIKDDPATEMIPVIHTSAATVAPGERIRGLNRGADAYLIEPIDPGEFIATVESTLRYYRARRRAERMATRMAALTRTTLAINAAESFDGLAAVAARGVSEIFGVDAAVFILPADGRVRRMVALERAIAPWPRPIGPDVLDRLAGLALGERAGTDVALVSNAVWRSVVPDTVAEGDVSLVLCRVKPGRPPVAVAVDAVGALDEEEFNTLRQLVQALALAMEAQRSYAEEHMIALTLQRSLLPARIPTVPGVEFAVRYEPAGEQAEVGGDFYEVLLVGERVLVAIGDVQGHSLHAATVMAEVRHALRAFTDEGHGLRTILNRLNSVMLHYHPDQTATVCLMLLDPATGELEIANAGHIPPLISAGGAAWYGRGGGVLIGFPAQAVGVEHLVVPPDGAVIMITDGLVEDRGVPLDENLERLRTLCKSMNGDIEEFSDRVLAEFGHREDDVALVVLRRVPCLTPDA